MNNVLICIEEIYKIASWYKIFSFCCKNPTKSTDKVCWLRMSFSCTLLWISCTNCQDIYFNNCIFQVPQFLHGISTKHSRYHKFCYSGNMDSMRSEFDYKTCIIWNADIFQIWSRRKEDGCNLSGVNDLFKIFYSQSQQIYK